MIDPARGKPMVACEIESKIRKSQGLERSGDEGSTERDVDRVCCGAPRDSCDDCRDNSRLEKSVHKTSIPYGGRAWMHNANPFAENTSDKRRKLIAQHTRTKGEHTSCFIQAVA
jgi:hypothetical protein